MTEQEFLGTEHTGMQYSVLIVDDERLARTLLEDYVSKLPMLRLVDSCANAMSAMSVMQREQVDILLSDIEMPEMTGVDFVENLPYRPSTIFTTAYSQYAIDGYELGVVDYLLKPIAFNRFVKAINKAIERIKLLSASRQEPSSQPQAQVSATLPEKPVDYLMVKADRRLYKVRFDDLFYIEGQQEYVTFHTRQRNITAFYSLKSLEEMLPQGQFLRIHKSFIVSLAHVEIVDSTSMMVAGETLPIGPSYRDTATRIFGL